MVSTTGSIQQHHLDSTIENGDNHAEQDHPSTMPLHHETTTSSSTKRQSLSSKGRTSRRTSSPTRNGGNEEQRSSNRKLVEEALDQSLSKLEDLESIQASTPRVARSSEKSSGGSISLGDHLERSVSRTKSNSSSNSSVRSGDSALSRRRQLRKKLKEACQEQWEKQHQHHSDKASGSASRDARSVASTESGSVVSSTSSSISGTRTRRRVKKPSDEDDASRSSHSSTRIRVRRSTAPSVQEGEDGEKKARPSPHVRRRKRHGPADTAPVTPRRAPSNDPSPARLGGETPEEEETFVPSRVQRSHSDSTSDRTMLRTSDHSDDSNEEESRPMAQPVVQPLDWDKIEPKKGSSSSSSSTKAVKEQPRRRFPALGRTFSLGARKSASFNSKDDSSVYSGAGRTVSSHSTASTASMSQSDCSTLSGDSSQGDASISSKSSVALNRGLSLKNFTNLVDRIKSDKSEQQSSASSNSVPPPPPAEGRSTPGSQGSKSRKSPRGRTMETNRDRRSRSKSVVFGSVTVREYERSVGDNPAVSSGTPISLGWEYIHLLDVAVDIYEATVRKPGPRSRKDFFLTPHQRFHLLMDEWEHSVHDIINAKNLATEIRYQRHVSIFGEPKQQQQQQQQQPQQRPTSSKSSSAAPSKGSSQSSGSSNLVKRATRGGAYPKTMSKKLPKLPKGESRWDSYPATTATAVGVQQ